MTKFELKELACKCGTTKVVKCLAHRDYSNWVCSSCAIKAKWSDPSYREARKAQKEARTAGQEPKVPKKRVRSRKSGLTKEEISDKISNRMRGRKLSDQHKASLSKKWSEPEYREKQLKRLFLASAKASIKSKELWADPAFAAKYQTPEFRQKMSEVTTNLWLDKAYRDKILATKSTDEFKAKMAAIQASPDYIKKLSQAAASMPKVSSIQNTLYGILDDLGVTYFREYNDKPDDKECIIGPYQFDCVIPRDGKWLLIECNGDWVHSLPRKLRTDAAKSTYVNSYLSDKYELKTIWEHEFHNHSKVVESVKYWLGLSSVEIEDFAYDQVSIRKAAASEYKDLLLKYHYLTNAGRGGIPYGAYLGDKLIAVCIFSNLPRQNIVIQGHKCCDLSRLCIHPRYQKKNFGSWFISRCIKLLPKEYTAVVAYADKTFNHSGTVYKASNFVLDKVVPADYWYRSSDGWVMHKKTLYNRATNLQMTESAFAEANGYVKVHGDIKQRYLFARD